MSGKHDQPPAYIGGPPPQVPQTAYTAYGQDNNQYTQPQPYGSPGPQQPGPYYQQGPPMGYHQQGPPHDQGYAPGPYPPHGQQGYPPQGYPPQGQYHDNRGNSGGGSGCIAGLLAALACCCCLDCLF